MDGEQAFRALRERDRNVPVVLMSGYSEQDATNRFVGEGLAGFLQKPFQFEDLMKAVRAASTLKRVGQNRGGPDPIPSPCPSLRFRSGRNLPRRREPRHRDR
ncbi:MAG: response regulator, partial [Tepidiformaceae bacterium]